MGISTTPRPVSLRRAATFGLPGAPWDAITAWALSFGLVFYLALRGGGYDIVVRADVGILVWWVVLLAAVAGLAGRLTPLGWLAVGALAVWAGWTALGIDGSLSQERTLAETGRLSAYVGLLALALIIQGRAGARHIINGVATALGAIAVLAVLSRLHPQWFPANAQLALGFGGGRLSYPLNYWNALACLLAMTIMVLLGVGLTARTRLGQALAVAPIPLCALGISLTASRAGVILMVIGVVLFLILSADRLAVLATMALTGAGSAILLVAAGARPAIHDGLDTATARADGSDLIWLGLIVCLGVAIEQVAVGLIARHASRPAWLRPSPRRTGAAFGVLALVAVVVFFASGLHHHAAHRFENFKQAPTATNQPSGVTTFNRLANVNGEGRWQFWQAGIDAYRTDRWHGIGGDAFVTYWQNHATVPGAIVDAHNLYVQTLAETGLIGAAMLAILVLVSVIGGVVRTLRSAGSERILAAAATTAMVLFWVEATIDWVWQLAVLPAVLFLLLAAVVGPRTPRRRPARLPIRGLAVAVAVAAFFPMAYSLTTTVKVRASQQAIREERYDDALSAARSAERVPGTSMTAVLQESLVLEAQGALDPALAAARRATAIEPRNWTGWLTTARIEAKLGRDDDALAALRRARSLNAKSPLFS
jgi:hypothetical protein